MNSRLIAAAVFVAASALPVLAAEVPVGEPGSTFGIGPAGRASENAVPDPQTWGGSTYTQVDYPAIAWTPLSDGQWSHLGTSGWSWRSGGSNSATCIDVHLPAGARVDGMTTWTDDTDAVNNITYDYYIANLVTNTGTTPFSFTTVGAPGIERTFRAFSAPLTIDNDRKTHAICVFQTSATASTRNAGATLWYKLQVSPGPAVATFPNDVPTTHPLFRFVEALAGAGISGGCGAGTFCPDAPLTRGQMAVFLAAALGLNFPN